MLTVHYLRQPWSERIESLCEEFELEYGLQTSNRDRGSRNIFPKVAGSVPKLGIKRPPAAPLPHFRAN